MFKITNKQLLNLNIKRVDIAAPAIVKKFLPGQFVMVTPTKDSHPVPLTIVDTDEKKGTISLIVHEVGFATRKLGGLSINEEIHLIQGPLGVPAQIDKVGLVVCVATGIGAAQILPICRALKKAGNKVVGIVGAKTKRAMMLEAQMRIVCDEIYITTNDGSYERRGLATEILKKLLDKLGVSRVYAIGSAEMMQAAAAMTREKNIPLFVTLSPLMLCANGICGSCRVKVGGQMRLACTDGPHFNGHEIDFEYLSVRMDAFEETDEWGNLKQPSSQKNEESKTFPKFLSAILRR
jgi:ferredoxin--NADP+ reductase